jgi:SAM-dependent methyltransferase
MVTADGAHAYPVVDGIAVLMAPERLHRRPGTSNGVDVRLPPYAECYQERALYSSLATGRVADGALVERLRRVLERADPASFPEPPESWHDGGSSASAYATAFRHLAPVAGRRVAQIGGMGTHAVKLLHAGADHAVVVSPVIDELLAGRAVADALGVADRCTFVCGVAEHLPLASGSIDRIYSGSSIHHTVTSDSLPECARVLAPGGRFASIDVWRNGRLYDLGIAVFGKRHGNEFCHALDDERIAPVERAFADVAVTHHGSFVRYPLSVWERAGRRLGPASAQRWTAAEDRWAERLPRLGRRTASLVLVRGTV